MRTMENNAKRTYQFCSTSVARCIDLGFYMEGSQTQDTAWTHTKADSATSLFPCYIACFTLYMRLLEAHTEPNVRYARDNRLDNKLDNKLYYLRRYQ